MDYTWAYMFICVFFVIVSIIVTFVAIIWSYAVWHRSVCWRVPSQHGVSVSLGFLDACSPFSLFSSTFPFHPYLMGGWLSSQRLCRGHKTLVYYFSSKLRLICLRFLGFTVYWRGVYRVSFVLLNSCLFSPLGSVSPCQMDVASILWSFWISYV